MFDRFAILPFYSELKCIFVLRQNYTRAQHHQEQDTLFDKQIILWKLHY